MGTRSGDGWRWAALAAAVWIQAAAGTNFDFPAYSTELKAALGASQVGLNGLAVASDLGKALGWSSGLAALRLPLPAVLAAAAGMGLAGYGLQWLLVARRLPLHYTSVFVLCLVAGCSICWFNTVCFALCTRAFPSPRRRPLALSLSVSFNGASAALYALLASALSRSPAAPGSLYLLLNALVPLAASAAALPPVLRYSAPNVASDDGGGDDSPDAGVFLFLHVLAFLTGLYLLVLAPLSSGAGLLLLAGAALLPLFVHTLLLPACRRGSPTRDWEGPRGLEPLHEPLFGEEASTDGDGQSSTTGLCGDCFVDGVMRRDRLVALGEEHTAGRLLRRVDFWLYYVAYLCGATVGLVYSNNLGQVAQSLGRGGDGGTTALVGVYSSCSFFGRLLSSFPDFFMQSRRGRLARTGWLAVGLAPMPAAFFLLAGGGEVAGVLLACTALVGLSSGFVFAAAVSVTAELFGAESVGVNHNILVTNIPIGSLLYGLLAAFLYDAGAGSPITTTTLSRDGDVGGGGAARLCMGRGCYAATFGWWGCITSAGLACSVVLFLRTRPAYHRFFEGRRPAPAAVWLQKL